MGGYGVFGDHRDTALCIPTHEQQTNNRGELLAGLQAIWHRNPQECSLICSDSKLPVMGATSKASKWKQQISKDHMAQWGTRTYGTNC